MRLLLIILAILSICSCGSLSDNVNDEIIDNFDNATKSKMILDYKISLENYKKKHENLIAQTTDSTYKHEINLFNKTFLDCLNYTDSLKVEMDKLDQQNPNNTEVIKRIFLNQGAADSLFKKIDYSYRLAESLVVKEEDKKTINEKRIRILNEPNSSQMKKQLFGFNSSTGVSMILYGFEVELFQMADIVIK